MFNELKIVNPLQKYSNLNLFLSTMTFPLRTVPVLRGKVSHPFIILLILWYCYRAGRSKCVGK